MNNQTVRVQVLVENTSNRKGLLGEHGLSYAIGKNNQFLLFDTGQGMALYNNASAAGIDLERIGRIGLSHGHYDHGGGLRFFSKHKHPPEIFAHPAAFQPKYAQKNGGAIYSVGISSLDDFSIDRFENHLVFTEKPMELISGIWLTGSIPRVNEYEQYSESFFLDDRGKQRDDLIDDQSLFFQSKQGIVVLLGCAHSGVINTLQFIHSLTGNIPFHHVAGGMHLLNASINRIQRTILDMNLLDVRYISPCHCTGCMATLALHNAFGERCLDCTVGTEFLFEME